MPRLATVDGAIVITDNNALELSRATAVDQARARARDRRTPELESVSRCHGSRTWRRSACEATGLSCRRSSRAAEQQGRRASSVGAISGILPRHGTRHPRARRFARFPRRAVRSLSERPVTSTQSWHGVLGERGARRRAKAQRSRHQRPRTNGHGTNGQRPRHERSPRGNRPRPARRPARRCSDAAGVRAAGRRHDVADRRAGRAVGVAARQRVPQPRPLRRARSIRSGCSRPRAIVELDPATWGFTERRPRLRDRADRRARPAARDARASSSRTCGTSTRARSASSSCTSRRRRAAAGSPSAWRRTLRAAAAEPTSARGCSRC